MTGAAWPPSCEGVFWVELGRTAGAAGVGEVVGEHNGD
jgi:hypothetical protein